MHQIKPLNDVLNADSRSSLWEMVNPQTGARRRITLEDHHRRFSQVRLNDGVPEDVTNGIATAANLYIYSWFVYSFGPVADLQCLATLELALRHRNGTGHAAKGPGLRALLADAIERGWLVDAGLPPEPPMSQLPGELGGHRANQPRFASELADAQGHVKRLSKSLPEWRNIIAHGSFMLFPPGNYMLMVVAALINQLWPEPA